MLDLSKKKVLPVKIADETTVNLKTPSKKLFKELLSLKDQISLNGASAENIDEMFESLTKMTATILSNNSEQRVIETSAIEKLEIDIGDMIVLFNEYIKFTKGVTSDPN